MANQYKFQDEKVENNRLTAIRLYEKALSETLSMIYPIYPDIENDQIYYDLSDTYLQLANYISNIKQDYYEAKKYFNSALEYGNKMDYRYDWLIKDIKTDEKVSYQLYIDREWKPFRIICKGLFKEVNVLKDCKPLVGKDILFIYHPNTLIKEKNGTVRVWVKEVNLKGKTEREANEYDYLKSLFEFDLKNKKFRILQQSTQYSSEVITSDNFPNAEWQFVSPETISETMVENLKIITK